MCPPLLALIPAVVSVLGTAGAGIGAAATAVTGLSAGTLGGITAGIGAVQAVASFAGGMSAHEQAVTAANVDYHAKMGAINAQNVQLSQEQSENTETGAIKMAQSFGRIAASATTLGLGKSTLAPYISGAQGGDARNTDIENLNIEGKRNQLGSDLYGAALQRKSTIDQTPSPGILSLVLGLGKAGLEGATTYANAGGKFNTGGAATT